MLALGLALVFASGLANGLFTVPMKLIPRWKWEHIWLVFIVFACLVMPVSIVAASISDPGGIWNAAPAPARTAALVFGFAWGFGSICFGMSVDRLGVSLANSLVIGLSSALGSLVPLFLAGNFKLEARHILLFGGVAVFLAGVAVCGSAGRMRDRQGPAASGAPAMGYILAIVSGVLSAVFNIGYAMAQPVAEAGIGLGYSHFTATNFIWLLMLSAGSIPNIVFCGYLILRNRSAGLFREGPVPRTYGLSILMGLLWGASIFLYGAATPMLGDIGPSIGWPLSLAVGLVVVNIMGTLLGEWRAAGPAPARRMRIGILVLLLAIALCAMAAKTGS
jgi:L-rhamnose-H+ transport protein